MFPLLRKQSKQITLMKEDNNTEKNKTKVKD